MLQVYTQQMPYHCQESLYSSDSLSQYLEGSRTHCLDSFLFRFRITAPTRYWYLWQWNVLIVVYWMDWITLICQCYTNPAYLITWKFSTVVVTLMRTLCTLQLSFKRCIIEPEYITSQNICTCGVEAWCIPSCGTGTVVRTTIHLNFSIHAVILTITHQGVWYAAHVWALMLCQWAIASRPCQI